jgi:hypothetical protein
MGNESLGTLLVMCFVLLALCFVALCMIANAIWKFHADYRRINCLDKRNQYEP